jgi:hypothetical protein
MREFFLGSLGIYKRMVNGEDITMTYIYKIYDTDMAGRGADHPHPSSAEVTKGRVIPLSTL